MCVVVGRFEEEELGQKIKAETIYICFFFIEANCIDWDIAVGFVGDCFFQLIRTLYTDILILFPNKDVIERLNYVINHSFDSSTNYAIVHYSVAGSVDYAVFAVVGSSGDRSVAFGAGSFGYSLDIAFAVHS